ncbi:unnamed protein product [Symbiodinium natans]|uniref:Methyltransferase FkbM domain-containing protein n=1 Tax=Symbiodinium natans TaxID=878477 RepID=A0A812PJN9_9DINO|nr:unnamed protein product [Symbiodinium natans]
MNVILGLARVAASIAACKVRNVPDAVCLPKNRDLCIPTEDFLFFRTRLSRVVLQRDLPWLAPKLEEATTEALVNVEDWKSTGALQRLRHSNTDLTAALALICEGLLEAERHALRLIAGVPAHQSGVLRLAVLLLQEVLAGPWSRVALSGWPVFALLARIARGLVLGFGSSARQRRSCAESDWKLVLQAANLTGVSMPPDNYTLFELADFKRFHTSYLQWDSSCLWEAADLLSVPTAPICVTVPRGASQPSTSAARDCNVYWPGCEAPEPSAQRSLQYRLYLPQRRELAADAIREEQRPYCALNHRGWVVSEAEHLFAKLAEEHRAGAPKRPLQLVEVGSNFGDCAFAVNAVARQVAWPLRATCFEPGEEAAKVFRKSLRLNLGARAAITVREEAVMPGDEKTVEFVVPDSSGVHGFVTGAPVEVYTKRTGMTPRKSTVRTSRLDRDFGGAAVVDLLLIGLVDGEMDVFQGAERLLSEMRAKSIVTFSVNETRLRQHFAALNYSFVKAFRMGVESLHLLRADASLG